MTTNKPVNLDFDWIYHIVLPVNYEFANTAKARQNKLTKPHGALGRLEQVAIQLASLSKTGRPCVDKTTIVIFAADHGIAQEKVSLYPQAVTAEMIRNFTNGGAAINVLAQETGAQLKIVNVGTIKNTDKMPQVYNRRVADGTLNFCSNSAMTNKQLRQAMTIGHKLILKIHLNGCDLFIGGEMGIGNTTSATALHCKLLNLKAADLTGPGTGLNQTGVAHKANVIEKALAYHQNTPNTPLETLACFGGFEIAALVGAYITCGQVGLPVLVDGYICSIAALIAIQLKPNLKDWLIFSHESHEPAHKSVLQHLDVSPLLKLDMRLGEASGAATAQPLLKMACALHNKMATFEEAAVSTAD